MSAPDTSLDLPLHLSLPDWRTALKKRLKRPKRPDPLTIGILANILINILNIVGYGYFAHSPGNVVAGVIGIAGWWYAFHHLAWFRLNALWFYSRLFSAQLIVGIIVGITL